MRRIVLIIIPIFVAAVLALFVVSRNRPPTGDNDLNAPADTPGTQSPSNANANNTNSGLPADTARQQVTTASRMFAERYASTSSQAPTANLTAAMSYASSSLKSAFERTIAASSAPTGDNLTVSSRAMAFNILYVDDRLGRAGVTVSLQRTERRGTARDRVYTQDLSLQLVREGQDWKVNVAVFAAI
ncbi:MAG: hypothetical protein HY976_03525 [Candidatus Kerfeldbacteria bacterium]|nr:hypothetical protein [Candidatus Kerfeldbacteria bacterium]